MKWEDRKRNIIFKRMFIHKTFFFLILYLLFSILILLVELIFIDESLYKDVYKGLENFFINSKVISWEFVNSIVKHIKNANDLDLTKLSIMTIVTTFFSFIIHILTNISERNLFGLNFEENDKEIKSVFRILVIVNILIDVFLKFKFLLFLNIITTAVYGTYSFYKYINYITIFKKTMKNICLIDFNKKHDRWQDIIYADYIHSLVKMIKLTNKNDIEVIESIRFNLNIITDSIWYLYNDDSVIKDKLVYFLYIIGQCIQSLFTDMNNYKLSKSKLYYSDLYVTSIIQIFNETNNKFIGNKNYLSDKIIFIYSTLFLMISQIEIAERVKRKYAELIMRNVKALEKDDKLISNSIYINICLILMFRLHNKDMIKNELIVMDEIIEFKNNFNFSEYNNQIELIYNICMSAYGDYNIEKRYNHKLHYQLLLSIDRDFYHSYINFISGV